MEVKQWFPPQRDERASNGFYTVLQEDFYNAYVNSGVAFRSQRVCPLEAIVAARGEQVHPHLTYLSGLADLLGWIGRYVASWVREFYASLWIDPGHRYIHFTFRGCDYRLYSNRVREILRIPESPFCLHEVCYRQIEPPRCPHGRLVPPTDLVRPCFIEPFGEGSSKTPCDLTPIAWLLDAIMRRTLLPRMATVRA